MERTSPRLVIQLADGRERVVDLREGRVNVGRAPDAGIRLPHENDARRIEQRRHRAEQRLLLVQPKKVQDVEKQRRASRFERRVARYRRS